MTTVALQPPVHSHGTPVQRIRRWLSHNALFVYTFAAIVYLMWKRQNLIGAMVHVLGKVQLQPAGRQVELRLA